MMETAWCLALLLAFGAVMFANPMTFQDCTLEPAGEDQHVKVFYTTSRVTQGCMGRCAPEADQEVHVLNIRYKGSLGMHQLLLTVSEAEGNATNQRKVVFVLNSNPVSILTVQSEAPHLTFVYNHRHIRVKGYVMDENQTNPPASLSGYELLQWAKTAYGEVTSFTDLENPQQIHFQVGKELGTAGDCIPVMNFNAGQYLTMEVASQEIQSCVSPSMNPEKEAHIVWLQQGPQGNSTQAVEMNVRVTCKEGEPVKDLQMLLVLKSQPELLWNIDAASPKVKFLSSGRFYIRTINSLEMNSTLLPDSKEGLIRKAQEMDFEFIASYTEIPSATSVTLELLRCAEQKTEVTTPAPTDNQQFDSHNTLQALINVFRPWKCTDNAIEITVAKEYLQILQEPVTDITLQDPLCRATENATFFVLKSVLENCFTRLERGIHASNQLVLTLASSPFKVTVPFQCDLPEKVFLQLYRLSDFRSPSHTVEINKVTYVQVLLRTADEEAALQLQECFLETKGKVSSQPLIHGGIPYSSSVKILDAPYGSPGTKIRRFSFIYKAEDGWSVSSATLVCRVRLDRQENSMFEGSFEVSFEPNVPPRNQDLGIGTVLGITFGAFLIGVLLTAALWYIYSHTRPMGKMQPTAANALASESSSTNPSIGSTQSTPCSTSSMA